MFILFPVLQKHFKEINVYEEEDLYLDQTPQTLQSYNIAF